MMNLLNNRRGEFSVSSALRLFMAVLLIAALMAIYRVYHVIGAVREKVNESVLAVASANVAEFYGGARESDGFARHATEDSFESVISTDDVIDTLSQSCGATDVDDAGTITVGENYEITNLSTDFVNADGSILNFKTTLTVSVPLHFGNVHVPIEKTITVRSSYDPRF